MPARGSSLLVGALLVVLVAACSQATPGAAPAPRASKPAAPSAAQAAPQSAARGDYFAGKTVTVLVNYSAGGPTDIFARMVAQYLDKSIPGHPTVIVENKPGAGGVIGANYLYNAARKDGLTLGIFSSPFSAQVLDGEGVQYDAAQFPWVGGVNESQVTYTHQILGARTGRELLTTNQEIVVGGLSPDSSKDLRMRVLLNLLGLKYKYVTGYPGTAEIVLALRRGEVNFADDSLTSWVTNVMPLVRAGTVFPLGQQGIIKGGQIVRDPRVADVPTYSEILFEARGDAVRQTLEYRALIAMIEIGSMLRALVYPPGVDPAVVEVMRQAVADTFASPDFQATAEKQLGFQFEFVPGVEAQSLAEKIVKDAADDPEPLDHLRRLARENR